MYVMYICMYVWMSVGMYVCTYVCSNREHGSRYCLTAKDESGEPPGDVFLDVLQALFPKHNPCGGFRPEPTTERNRCRCTKAIAELGLQPRDIEDTLRDTGNSLIALGCVPPMS